MFKHTNITWSILGLDEERSAYAIFSTKWDILRWLFDVLTDFFMIICFQALAACQIWWATNFAAEEDGVWSDVKTGQWMISMLVLFLLVCLDFYVTLEYFLVFSHLYTISILFFQKDISRYQRSY